MLVFRQVNLGEIFFCFTNFTKTFDLKSGVDKTGFCLRFWTDFALPKGSMYGIFTYTWLKFMVNVGKYTVYGSCGLETTPKNIFCLFIRKYASMNFKQFNAGKLYFLGLLCASSFSSSPEDWEAILVKHHQAAGLTVFLNSVSPRCTTKQWPFSLRCGLCEKHWTVVSG